MASEHRFSDRQRFLERRPRGVVITAPRFHLGAKVQSASQSIRLLLDSRAGAPVDIHGSLKIANGLRTVADVEPNGRQVGQCLRDVGMVATLGPLSDG